MGTPERLPGGHPRAPTKNPEKKKNIGMTGSEASKTVAFVVPAFRRYDVSRIAFAGLRWTIAELRKRDIEAFAVVIADDSNLNLARQSGFATLNRPNVPLGKKWNDGFQYAALRGADYLIPLGSDNWIHPELVLRHLANMKGNTVGASRVCSIVREDGRKIAHLSISYNGGDGVRVFPRSLLEPLRFRPCEESRRRSIDGSIAQRIRRATGRMPRYTYTDYGPLQIVGFQSGDVQLNRYDALVKAFGVKEATRPFAKLASVYPARLVEMAERVYLRRRLAA